MADGLPIKRTAVPAVLLFVGARRDLLLTVVLCGSLALTGCRCGPGDGGAGTGQGRSFGGFLQQMWNRATGSAAGGDGTSKEPSVPHDSQSTAGGASPHQEAGRVAEAGEPARFAPAPAADARRIRQAYDDLTEHYRRIFRALVASFQQAARGSGSLEEFFSKTSPALARYDAARRNLRGDYARLAGRERAELNRRLARARAKDRQEGGMRHVRAFLNEEARRESDRNAQVNQLQRLLDRAADDVGSAFRMRFHEKLEGEMAELRKRGSSAEETRTLRERVNAAINRGDSGGQRRRYAHYWVGHFLRHRSEPAPRKEAPPSTEEETVILNPARPDFKKEEPPRKTETKQVERKEEKPRETDLVLDCRNNECNLEQYRRFLASLPRSCPGSTLPDVLIKHCFADFVHLDLSTPRRREIMNFIRFSGNNFFDRMRGLSYFEEVCYPFRPVLELGDQMIRDETEFTTDQKVRIRQGLESIRRCR